MSAATDVTGFGLAGHALEMARGAGLTVEIEIVANIGSDNVAVEISSPFDHCLLLGSPLPAEVYLDVELLGVIDVGVAAGVGHDQARTAAAGTTDAGATVAAAVAQCADGLGMRVLGCRRDY